MLEPCAGALTTPCHDEWARRRACDACVAAAAPLLGRARPQGAPPARRGSTLIAQLLAPLVGLAATVAYCFAAAYWLSALCFVTIDDVKVGVLWSAAKNDRAKILALGELSPWVTDGLRASGLIALVSAVLLPFAVFFGCDYVGCWAGGIAFVLSLPPLEMAVFLAPFAQRDPSHRTEWSWTGTAVTALATAAQLAGFVYLITLHRASRVDGAEFDMVETDRPYTTAESRESGTYARASGTDA